jgi:predicted acetyltransferase
MAAVVIRVYKFSMADPYPMRPISEDEFADFLVVPEHAFNSIHPAGLDMEHSLMVTEFDRTLAAFDQAQIVGTAGALTLQMSVPGGLAAAAGVTVVTVLPSHRRRGILTSLMHRQLADIRDRGEVIAALYPSEAGIYGRYGYGAAVTELDFTIRRGEGSLRSQPPVDGGPGAGAGAALRLRIADPVRVVTDMARVYRSVLPARPGMLARDDRWWDFALWDPLHRRSGGGPLRCVVAEDDTGPRGYVLYSAQPGERDHGLPGGVLQARELMAADPQACAAIWADLLSRDLVAEVRARRRPVDDPLPYLLADSGRARPEIVGGLWVRLVSVPGALTGRRYPCDVDLVIDVTDDLLAENAGRWRLRAAALEHATCERTSAPAEVALPVAALGAAYLGCARLSGLAGAGLVTELRPGALTALSAAMSWEPAPWCPTRF